MLSFEQLEVTKIEGELNADDSRAETPFEFKIVLSSASEKVVTANWLTSNLTARASDPADAENDDYLAVPNATEDGIETFAPGETEKTITVIAYGDDFNEAHELFYVILRDTADNNASVDVAKARATAIIENDDNPVISILPASGTEATNGMITFTASISPPIEGSETVTATVATVRMPTDTAIPDVDYHSKSGDDFETLTFDKDNPTDEFSVILIDDELDENDETFTVVIDNANSSDPTNYPVVILVENNSAMGTIVDDDVEPTITLVDPEVAIRVAEGDSGSIEAEFSVELTGPTVEGKNAGSGRDVILSYYTSETTQVGVRPATSDIDFTLVPEDNKGTITIPAGETTGTITIEVLGDDEFEGVEQFIVTIADPTGAVISGETKKTIVITDNDADLPRLSVELNSELVIDEGETIDISVVSGATAPSAGTPIQVAISVEQVGDFVAFRIPRSIVMTSNSEDISIRTLADSVTEANGTVTVSISKTEGSFTVDPRKSSVEVMVRDITPEDENLARISIASNAVDAILRTLNIPGVVSPPSESSPAIELPKVSVVAVVPVVDEGAPVQFNISGSGNLNNNVLVEYTLSGDGDFFDNLGQGIYRIKLSAVQPNAQVEITTIDDNYAEQDGTLTLTLLDGRTYDLTDQSNASVAISDLEDRQQRTADITAQAQAFLPDLMGIMGASTVDLVTERSNQNFNGNNELSLELGGESSVSGLITMGGEMINENTTALKSFLGDSSFAFSLLSGDDFTIPATVWGFGDYQNITSEVGNNSSNWSGDLFSGRFGIDAMISDGLMAGLSASISESEIVFDQVDADDVKFISQTTTLNPYFGWTSSDQNSELHAITGYGRGEIGVAQETYEDEAFDSESYTFGLTGSQLLYSSDSILSGTSNLSVKGESWLARQHITGKTGLLDSIETNAQHFNIRTEASHQFDLVNGSYLNPIISVGLRRDQKNLQSIWGLEFIGGANYTSPVGLTLAGNGNLLVGEDNQIQKLGLDSSLTFDWGSDKRGWLMEITPAWGQTNANIQNSLWSRNILDANFESGQYTDGTSLNSEIGFGLEILQGNSIITPFGGFDYSDSQGTEYQVGTRMSLGTNAKLNLTGTQSTNSTKIITNKVRLEGSFSW